MSKYTPEELRHMAETLIAEREAGDEHYLHFVMMVSAVAQVTPDYVVRKIAEYASYTP